MERILVVLEDKSMGAPSETGYVQRNRKTHLRGPSSKISYSSATYVRTSPDKIRYDMYLTDRRIVVAVVFSQADTSRSGEVQTVSQSMAASRASMSFAKIRDQRRQEFKDRTPDEILRMHNDSFEIPLDQIHSIGIKKGILGTKLEVDIYRVDELEKLSAHVPKEKVGDVSAFLDICPTSKVIR